MQIKIALVQPTKKYPREMCYWGCTGKHEPQAWFQPRSFHPRFPVAFCIDAFIIGLKKMVRVYFQQITKKKTMPKLHTQDWVLNV